MTADPFRNYDAWLEAPYQAMYADWDRFSEWCEAEGLDPEDRASVDAYEAWCEDGAADAAERRAEARADRDPDW